MSQDVSIIVAAAENDLIGRGDELPWRLSSDLKHFRKLTTGNAIIMGRRTWDSIGRPLPKRQNIVITRNTDFQLDAATVVHTPEQAIDNIEDGRDCFIIGGAEIYKLFLPIATRIYLTRVHARPDGDVYLPSIDWNAWTCIDSREQAADEKNEHPCTYQTWVRRS